VSRLPEPGDVRRAQEMLDARVHAIADGAEHLESGPVSVHEGHLVGGADPIFAAYGDLFDPGEVLSEIGFLMVKAAAADVVRTMDPLSALSTLLLQGMALGVLQERLRWEDGRREAE
jgi:hypothetical protein